MNLPTGLRNTGTILTTLFTFAVTIWALYWVFRYMGSIPTVDSTGKVVLDKFDNAKSILLVLLPLATTAIGYWLGNIGTTAATNTAQTAKADAESARKETATVNKKLNAVLDEAAPGVLDQAKAKNQALFD
jgi:hypothetical protein